MGVLVLNVKYVWNAVGTLTHCILKSFPVPFSYTLSCLFHMVLSKSSMYMGKINKLKAAQLTTFSLVCVVLFCLGSWYLQVMKLLLYGQVLQTYIWAYLADICHKAMGRIHSMGTFLGATHCKTISAPETWELWVLKGWNTGWTPNLPTVDPVQALWLGWHFYFPIPGSSGCS